MPAACLLLSFRTLIRNAQSTGCPSFISAGHVDWTRESLCFCGCPHSSQSETLSSVLSNPKLTLDRNSFVKSYWALDNTHHNQSHNAFLLVRWLCCNTPCPAISKVKLEQKEKKDVLLVIICHSVWIISGNIYGLGSTDDSLRCCKSLFFTSVSSSPSRLPWRRLRCLISTGLMEERWWSLPVGACLSSTKTVTSRLTCTPESTAPFLMSATCCRWDEPKKCACAYYHVRFIKWPVRNKGSTALPFLNVPVRLT